jgi:hypothetical protein
MHMIHMIFDSKKEAQQILFTIVPRNFLQINRWKISVSGAYTKQSDKQ